MDLVYLFYYNLIYLKSIKISRNKHGFFVINNKNLFDLIKILQ
jgi:hypothetical protein